MGKSFKNVGSRLILTLAAALTLVLMTAFPTKAEVNHHLSQS